MNLQLQVLQTTGGNKDVRESAPIHSDAYHACMFALDYIKNCTPTATVDMFRVYSQEYDLNIKWSQLTGSRLDVLSEVYKPRIKEFFYQCILTKLGWMLNMWRGNWAASGKNTADPDKIFGYIPKGSKQQFRNFISLPGLVGQQNIQDIWKPRIDSFALTFYGIADRNGGYLAMTNRYRDPDWATDKGFEILTQDEMERFEAAVNSILQYLVCNCNRSKTAFTNQRQFDFDTLVEQIIDIVKLYINVVAAPHIIRVSDWHTFFNAMYNRLGPNNKMLACASSYSHVDPNAAVCMFPGTRYAMGYNAYPNKYAEVTKFLIAQAYLGKTGGDECAPIHITNCSPCMER